MLSGEGKRRKEIISHVDKDAAACAAGFEFLGDLVALDDVVEAVERSADISVRIAELAIFRKPGFRDDGRQIEMVAPLHAVLLGMGVAKRQALAKPAGQEALVIEQLLIVDLAPHLTHDVTCDEWIEADEKTRVATVSISLIGLVDGRENRVFSFVRSFDLETNEAQDIETVLDFCLGVFVPKRFLDGIERRLECDRIVGVVLVLVNVEESVADGQLEECQFDALLADSWQMCLQFSLTVLQVGGRDH